MIKVAEMDDDSRGQTIDIDMRGQVCPSTLLVSMDNLNKYREALQGGSARLRIKTDNREATTTIPTTAENMGYVVQVRNLGGYYQIEISSSGSANDNL